MILQIMHDLLFQLIEPVFEKYQNIRFGDRHQLFGLGHFLDQALAHIGWVDTFAHAFGKSEIHHAGNFILTRAIDQICNKIHSALFVDMGKNLFKLWR